ncbi:MAG TPA: YggU family protein [Chromatiales bacterium]|nr:YggU family protein [Chromatiales bacterium]
MNAPVFQRWDGDDLILRLRVQPRASSDGFGEVLGDRIKLRLTAPPVDGKANAHLQKVLSKLFRVPRGAVTILRGESSRDKEVRIAAPRRLPDGFTPP